MVGLGSEVAAATVAFVVLAEVEDEEELESTESE
jgi:hypothetical protein